MAYPKSLQQPFRKGMLLVGGGWRGFFATYNSELAASTNNTSLGPTIVDLQVQGPFNEGNMPDSFFDLGWISKFKMTPASKIGQVRSGYRGAVRAIYRGEVGETFEFSFRESSRLAWKISTGAEVFNLLSNPTAVASQIGPLSSSGSQAVPIGVSGYNASYLGNPTLFMPAGSGAQFPAGSYIVADDDYNVITQPSGLVGYGGVPVWPNSVNDVDFGRKTSDFVARVVKYVASTAGGNVTGQDYLVLNEAFVGGGCSPTGNFIIDGPGSTAKVQLVKGFSAREGGTYVTEWSALFLMDCMDQSQIALYYPHVASNQFKDFANWAIENAGTTDLTGYELDCVMQALAYDDPLDGETVVRYAAYYPSPGKDIQG
jgi:hypothetical protein